jgi:hypothetical protein
MAGNILSVTKSRRACRQCKIKRVSKLLVMNDGYHDPDRYSSNAMKPLQLAVIAYSEAGNVQVMESTYAGLPNMNALVLCR